QGTTLLWPRRGCTIIAPTRLLRHRRLCRGFAKSEGYPRSSVYARETRPLRTAPRLDFDASRYCIKYYRSPRQLYSWRRCFDPGPTLNPRARASAHRLGAKQYIIPTTTRSARHRRDTPNARSRYTRPSRGLAPVLYIFIVLEKPTRPEPPRGRPYGGGSAGSRHPLGFQVRYVNFADRIAPAFRWFFA